MAKFGIPPAIGTRAPMKSAPKPPFGGSAPGAADRDGDDIASPAKIGRKAQGRYTQMRKGIRGGTR